MSKLLQDKRKTRGLRMAALIGDAEEQDQSFWGNEIWAEDESDDSFSEEEVKPDEFDSDFNDSEDDGDEEDSNDEPRKESQRASSNKYREPGHVKRTSYAAPAGRETAGEGSPRKSNKSSSIQPVHKKPRISSGSSVASADFDNSSARTKRESTKAKTSDAEQRLLEQEKVAIVKRQSMQHVQPVIRHQFTQKELLIDALETEKRNKKWLESQKFYAEGHGEADALKKSKLISQGSPGSKGMVRKLSRRGIYNSITFTDENLIPGFLRDPEPLPVQPDNICVITGKVAKYKDSLTLCPYADLAAFKELRLRHQMRVNV